LLPSAKLLEGFAMKMMLLITINTTLSTDPTKTTVKLGKNLESPRICFVSSSEGKLGSFNCAELVMYPNWYMSKATIANPAKNRISPGKGLSSQTQDLPASRNLLTETARLGTNVENETNVPKMPIPVRRSMADAVNEARTVNSTQYQYSDRPATPLKFV